MIVDDGSTDASAQIIREYAIQYPWITPIFLKTNRGVAHATNRGLGCAKGSYILRIDSDDMLLPERIGSQLDFLESNPGVDVLGGNCWYIDAESQERIARSNFPVDSEAIAKLFRIGENGVLNGTTMVRAKWFADFKYRQEMVWAEDYDLFARMLERGARFAGMDEPLTLVRVHRNSATSNLEWSTLEKAFVLSQELFNNQRPLKSIRRNYLHIKYYRRFLLEKNPLVRILNLFLAAVLRPDKVVQRVLNK